jgi:hypothetical protein
MNVYWVLIRIHRRETKYSLAFSSLKNSLPGCKTHIGGLPVWVQHPCEKVIKWQELTSCLYPVLGTRCSVEWISPQEDCCFRLGSFKEPVHLVLWAQQCWLQMFSLPSLAVWVLGGCGLPHFRNIPFLWHQLSPEATDSLKHSWLPTPLAGNR